MSSGTATGAASALSVATHFGVGLVVGVAVGAVLYTALGMVLTKRVRRRRDRLEVGRVDAQPDPTEVVELEPFWDFANEVLITDPVRGPFPLSGSGSVFPVPALGDGGTLPNPASGRIFHDETSEPSEFGSVESHGSIMEQPNREETPDA